MSEVFYTSDIHIGHNKVAELRGFYRDEVRDAGGAIQPVRIVNTDMHDAWLAAVWDSTVKKDDSVFVMGDISINGGQHALDWIAARPGIKHLISGNHDPVHPMHRTATKALPEWGKYFETIQPFLRRKLLNSTLLLSHFPYASWGDGPGREGSRYDQYRLPDHGELLLHGHTHGTEKAHDNMLHVGIDAWQRLVPQSEVIEWVLKSQQEKS